MRTFIIKSGDESTFKDLGKYLRELGNQEKTKGKNYCVVVKQNRPIRSMSANGYYHIILTMICSEANQYTHEQLHEICKRKFNYEMVQFPKSGYEVVGKSTKNLDTKEFAAFVNRVKLWALEEFNIVVPDARDIDYQKQIEIENNWDKIQSGW